jgi:O-antigen/teichoic acid export membrane protein
MMQPARATSNPVREPITLRKSVVGAIWLSLQPFALSAIALPATIFVIRTLGPTGYGEWSAATSLVTVFSVMTTFGFRPLLTRAVAQRPEAAAEETAYQLTLRAMLAFAAAWVAIGVCVTLGYSRTVLACTAIGGGAALFAAGSSVFEDVLQGFQQLLQIAVVTFIAGVTLTLLSVVAAALGGGAPGVAVAYAIGPVVSLLWLAILAGRRFPVYLSFDPARFKAAGRESRLLGTGFVVAAVRDRVESLLLPKLMGVSLFGYFAAGVLLADRLVAIPSNLATAFFPLISSKHAESPDAAVTEIRRLILIGQVICLPMCVLVAFYADPIASVLFRSNPGVAAAVVRATIWALPLQALLLAFNTSLQATGGHDAAGRANLMTSAVSLPAAVALISAFGVGGAATSWILRQAIGAAFSFAPFKRRFGAALHGLPVMSCIGALSGMLLVAYAGARFLPGDAIGVIAGAGLAAASYAVLLLVLRVVRFSELRQLWPA